MAIGRILNIGSASGGGEGLYPDKQYLYDNGTEYIDFLRQTNGIPTTSGSHVAYNYVSFESNYFKIGICGGGNTGNSADGIYTAYPIDITHYKQLIMNVNNTSPTISLDVSDLSGEYYVFVGYYTNSSGKYPKVGIKKTISRTDDGKYIILPSVGVGSNTEVTWMSIYSIYFTK